VWTQVTLQGLFISACGSLLGLNSPASDILLLFDGFFFSALWPCCPSAFWLPELQWQVSCCSFECPWSVMSPCSPAALRIPSPSSPLLLFFETGPCDAAQAGLKLMILLQAPACWDYKCTPLRPVPLFPATHLDQLGDIRSVSCCWVTTLGWGYSNLNCSWRPHKCLVCVQQWRNTPSAAVSACSPPPGSPV
jgi:hypothetical protein